jgi:3-deoxy-D-manno-octulosonic acid kinase
MGDKIKQELMTKELWIKIGQCLSRFHQQGIVHKDLNIENIQIDANDKVFFLDFDKTRFSKSSPQILEANLRRLRKSILKLTLLRNQDFPDKGWIDLVTATSY